MSYKEIPKGQRNSQFSNQKQITLPTNKLLLPNSNQKITEKLKKDKELPILQTEANNASNK